MGNGIELLSLKCASCGAALQGFQGKSEVNCDFCNNTTQVLRPIKVEASVAKLSASESERFNNIVSIMAKSMVAGNYKEAYDYCNKALEIDSDSAALWENKAICSFWLRSDQRIIASEAREILTYLTAAKQADPNSPTYEYTVKAIAFNLFFAARYKLGSLSVFKNANLGLAPENLPEGKKAIDYIKTMDLCFDLYPKVLFLDTAVQEISKNLSLVWTQTFTTTKNMKWCTDANFDAIKFRENYINKIKKIDPSYVAPEFATMWTKQNIIIAIVLFVIIIIFYKYLGIF